MGDTRDKSEKQTQRDGSLSLPLYLSITARITRRPAVRFTRNSATQGKTSTSLLTVGDDKKYNSLTRYTHRTHKHTHSNTHKQTCKTLSLSNTHVQIHVIPWAVIHMLYI